MKDLINFIGKVLDEPQPRDAIHVALMSIVAGEDMYRGERVVFDRVNHNEVLCARNEKPVGIIDPFLDDKIVKRGQCVLMFVWPGTVTGMRHEWQHPVIDALEQPPDSMRGTTKKKSEEWLRNFADRFGTTYEYLIDVDDWITLGDSNYPDFNEKEEFWNHVENITGKKFCKIHRENTTWSCSC